ncbi:hypothetical protein IGL98_003403 [Enterococcus sp. DIV0840]|uniref:pectate lyase-like adhesive domain-containing protein n=1 Tax=Enterococcus TaxID=1350 RepID=UPI001A8C942E|nr:MULTISPECIES: pectate lyase-like adhesive domain-containing protein [Enterococcus]MBO0433148.1 hypothetical protein [Enterococcus sp. DIV0849a]MBO0473895.1 hypothetical protein [Enterococcus ureasiticus]
MKMNKKIILASFATLAISSQVALANPSIVGATETSKGLLSESLVTEDSVEVSTFGEFQQALMTPEVSHIILTQSFSMEKNITKIPQRNLLIDGNSDKGVVLSSEMYALYGENKLNENVILELNNINIQGAQKDGSRFLEQVSDGWDVNVTDTTYTGARFLLLSNGKVTFRGNNKIDTIHENAWVHEVVFAKNSVYNSTAANGAQRSAFYFNGKLNNGKADGKVIVEENAEVNIKISSENEKYYYYPAFYDKVSQVDVKENASLNIDSAGIAIQFIPRADFDVDPSLNIESGAVVNLNGRGGGNYPTVRFGQKNSTINAKPGSTLNITGNNSKEVIETAKNAQIILNNPKAYDLKNTNPKQPIFDSKDTSLSISNANVNVWEKIGGDYETDPLYSWSSVESLTTIINKDTSSETVSTNADLQEKFQTADYGRISGAGETEKIIDPTFNPVTDKDDQLTGTGQPGALIVAYVGDQKLGETVVGADGRWTIAPIEKQTEGTVIHIIQNYEGQNSDKVEQTVVHLGEETINYFKLGYWQEYGMILEGSVDNIDWPLEDSSKVRKTVNLIDTNSQQVKAEIPVANTDWYQAGQYNGYQAILDNELLSSLEPGEYKLQIGVTIEGTEINETNDLNVKNTMKKSLENYPGPYHQDYEKIESRVYEGKVVYTFKYDNLAHIKVETK